MEYRGRMQLQTHQAVSASAPSTLPLSRMANAIRALSMDAVEQANSGHPGMPMGFADVAAVLWGEFVSHDPANPTWPDRDRVVLSAGHGSMLLYSILHLTGYSAFPIEELKRFRQLGSKTPGHPEAHPEIGIETTTGPLGQGFANAIGMALAERMMHARFGDALVNHYTYVICGDGDLMEGISHEAASLAGHLGLHKLIALYDDNQICIDGPTELSFSDDTPKRFESYGWNIIRVNGHDMGEVRAAITKAKQSTDKPTMILCRTTIAHGAPSKAGKSSSHGAPLGADEIKGARVLISWPHAPFEVPDDVAKAWLSTTDAGKKACKAWQEKFASLPKETTQAFDQQMAKTLSDEMKQAIAALKKDWSETPRKEATRKSSGNFLQAMVAQIPFLAGGSADLSESNNTHTKGQAVVKPRDYAGSYIHYGVREHAMASMMNGMALHGGFIPFGGTFLVFSDYARPAMRLSALMKQQVIYVMTHDSIGLGEDGPTHQPVEHLAALRAIPNLWVFRPADAVETLECWELALTRKDGPSVLVLSRQNVTPQRTSYVADNRCDRGGYVLREEENAKVTLFATGTEVMLAAEAADALNAKGIPTRIVSMPCFELFDMQSETYRQRVIGDSPVRIAVEAAIQMGWERYLGDKGIFIGMTGFGDSAPAPELYKHFGITVDAVVKAAEERL